MDHPDSLYPASGSLSVPTILYRILPKWVFYSVVKGEIRNRYQAELRLHPRKSRSIPVTVYELLVPPDAAQSRLDGQGKTVYFFSSQESDAAVGDSVSAYVERFREFRDHEFTTMYNGRVRRKTGSPAIAEQEMPPPSRLETSLKSARL